MATDLRAALEERGERMSVPDPETEVKQPKPQVAPGERTGSSTGSRHKVQDEKGNGKLRILLIALGTIAVAGLMIFGTVTIFRQVFNTRTVPDLVGMELTEAQVELTRNNLKYSVSYVTNDTYSKGIVYMQNPSADSPAHVDDCVILMVSDGPSAFTMPNVINMSATDATALLESRGMRVTRDREASSDVAVDYVMRQFPAAEEMVTVDTPVTLTISGGVTVIPNLAGQTLQEAEISLLNQNLTLHPALKYVDTEIAELHGTVAAQMPDADTRVAQNTAVTLTIYQYRENSKIITFTAPESEQQQVIRLAVQASGSTVEIDSRTTTLGADDSRKIEYTLVIPDDRTYSVFVYINDVLNSQQVINFFVKLADGVEILNVEGGTLKGTQIIGGDTYYKFNTEEINVLNMDTDYTLTVYTTEGIATITANALTYIHTVVKDGSTFSLEKQYAMVAYYYYVSCAYNVLVNSAI
jgi:serine/threonine-protein kinase